MWQTIITNVGGTAAIALALGWLVRSLITHYMDKDVDRFRDQLAKEAHQHNVVFSRLHERRVETVDGIYGRLVLAQAKTEAYLQPLELAHPEHVADLRKAKGEEAVNALESFWEYSSTNAIWLSHEIENQVNEILELLREQVSRVAWARAMARDEESGERAMQEWGEAWSSVQRKVPVLRAALAKEFRRLLGVLDER